MRGMYQGYANIFYGAGQFLGPIIGGFCIAVDPKNGWRWMFSAQVPFVCFAAILVIYNIHEYTYDVEERMKNRFKFTNLKKIDLLGSCVLSCVIISNLMLFGAKSSETAYFFLGTGILSACLFYYVEKYVAYEQIVPLFIFRGMLIITSFVSMFGTMTSYGTSFLLPLYLQIVHNFTSFQLGVFNSFAVFSVSFGSLFAGYLLRHDKPVSMELIMSNSIKVSIMGCTLMFWGTLVTLGLIHTIKPTLLDMEFSLLSMGILAFSFALNGFGYGVFLVSTLILIVAKVGPKHQAAVTGMNYLFRSIGSASGVGITLSIYQNRLYAELYHYFMKKKRPDGKEILDKLIENTFYIRQGLDPKYIHKVLNIYKDAISDSTIIVLIVATISLVFCITLQLYPLNARIDR
ncbi:hypothetical protein CANARDRAFT_200417 [[Candida] arabinofermentans NRRL YB-2248]|uniref:Major facilitator superfamily (MFS) profile domain-containing protein n=1 Tax=[Candida] arabinofermentans NRRL YB-2248 TaxID=983967 RepID=A0A1E4SYW8_9ASCO|nr:hypothetical protein CANARDRAFT_200417 [[Candida] arabinofermentans NRRL YB-2248]